ncbi:MAG: tetratricopeptide repeat protein, partial [Nitrospinae bacterium]|nr:tetratricopeptide repeat protein [Nitrospinota bacterium]
ALAEGFGDILITRPVLESVIAAMDLPFGPEQLGRVIDSITIRRIVSITVTDPDPLLAANIANVLAKEAVDYFSKTLELHEKTGNTVSLSKALRNIANNLYMLSEKKQKDPAGSLNDALSKYFNAIENLEKFGIAEKKKKESSAMLTIDVEASLSEDASTAAQGFDMSGEQKLIFHYVGKIYGDFGEYDRAIEYFEKKLAFIPDKLDPKENIPVLLEKALLLNQLGNYHYLSGRYDRAAEYFKKSYATSKLLDNRQGIAVNAANLGRLFLLKSRLKPARSLQAAMNGALDLIEEASLLLASDDKAFANPEYRVYLKNYLGILYHFQAFHFPVDRPEEKTSANQKMDEKAILNAALESLGEDYSLAKKSRRQFEEARSLAEKLDGPQRGQILVALRQNLDLANYLSLAKTDKLQPDADTAAPDLLFSQWQFKYLKAMMAQGKERFNLLKEADSLLTELPYGYTRGPASLPMQEDLYQALTEISFNDKHFRDALRYSEKGLQQNLITLRQEVPLQLDDPVRKKAYEKLTSLSKSLSEIAREDEAGSERIKNILAEYNKNLADLKKKDPRFAALFYPSVPDIKQMQKLLPAGRVYLKLQKSGNRVLLWVMDSKEFQGGVIPENEKLLQILARLGRYGAKAQPGDLEFLSETFFSPLQQVLASAKSLIIEAAGEMEFLPWPAMLLDGKPIIQKMPITFQSSLSQFYESQINKNLYNSRLLTVEADAETYKTVSGNFASARNLAGKKSTVKNFRQDFKKFGVVSVNSRTYLGGLSSARSFISLTNRRNHFERMRLEDLFRYSVESNFIALNDVEFELQPDSGISPTASLIQGLTYMGYPGILLNTGPVDKKTHADFQKLFFSSFRKGNPAESLRQAQLKLMQANPESLAWTQYRFYGFPGMTEQEKNQFAKAEYLNNATKGNEALTKHQDFSAAIGYLEKALVLIDFLPEEAGGAKIIYMGLGEAAYAMKDFKKAVDYQTRAVELVEAEGEEADLEELAQAQFKLGIYYSEAEDFIPAVENLNKALAFYEEYEFGAELAHGYSELGKVEESAVKYDKALKAFTASAKISGQEDVAMDFDKGQQLRNIGKIYLKRLNRYDEAAKYYAEANKVFL